MNDDLEKEASASSKTFKTRAWSDKTSTRPLETKVKTSHKASAQRRRPAAGAGYRGSAPVSQGISDNIRIQQSSTGSVQGFRLNRFSIFFGILSLPSLWHLAGIRGRNTRRRQQPPKYGHTVKVEVAY